ncbi:L,D-transpeptidase family protein [Chitinophaga pendula]|uniref:L,D-transpeptidase family protein n=1 Tax=Chitinophaga TaxID=79328 RepID=UPI0012FD9F91|nr:MULTISPECIES: L,D-transpeptidase family protein [Chitinophaga]UCJ06464.1 L,D-transpeptidase family protein [Chitinophaga pendula]
MPIRYYAGWLILLLLVAASCGRSGKGTKQPKVRDTTHYTRQEYIDLALDSSQVGHFLQSHPEYQSYREYIQRFYQKRDYHYAWISNDGLLTEQAGNFINLMKNDPAYLVNDSSRVGKPIQQLYDTLVVEGGKLHPGDVNMSKIELMLTAQFFLYGNKVWGGMTADSAKDLEWFIPRKKLDMESVLDSMLKRPATAFEEGEPVNKQYKLLRDALRRMGALEAKGAWDSLKIAVKSYKKGDSAQLIAAVKTRLHALGDLPVIDSGRVFTPMLDSAIRIFEQRMGLKEDGLIRQGVLDALNIPLQQRIRQLLVNMERLRWVPIEPASDYLLVNIPEFKLHVYQEGKLDWSCNVVVGRPGTNTVIFSKNMRFVVFSPYWNVPPGILAHEVLPAAKRNPGYLARQNMEVVGSSGKVIPASAISWGKYSGGNFPYIVRQKPGNRNALGKVKFLFPNEYNIYLHDTPSRGLFGETKRSFSHGCIRVAEPAKLADWLLRKDSAWTPARIETAMNAGKEQFVTLKNQVPVFIGYFTAFVDSKGHLNFREDVYGHDARLAQQLFGK